MDLRGFLSTIVPEGLVIMAKLEDGVDADNKPFKYFSHTIARNYDEAVAAARKLVLDRRDVYFALASYKQGWHKNAKGKTVVRVGENVDALKALWFDIDFKSGYAGLPEALAGLKAFSQATQMPPPSIVVGSGNGIHVYWPLDTPVPPDRWKRLSGALKEAAKQSGLIADLACTGDACRVLRPPWSINWKDPNNPKRVELLYSCDKTFSYESLEAILVPWLPKGPVTGPATVNDYLTGGVGGRPATPSNFTDIVKHCGVLKHVSDSHGKDCDEPFWMATLQLLKHCEDGHMHAHAVSDGHPGYTQEGTDRKWEQRLANDAGPTLCQTFAQWMPDTCKGCPHAGFVKSPIQLGHGTTRNVNSMPYGWRLSTDKTKIERMISVDSPDGTSKTYEWVTAIPYAFDEVRVVRSYARQDYEIRFRVINLDYQLMIPGSFLGKALDLRVELCRVGVMVDEKGSKHFGDLMRSWISELQANRLVADVTEQLGWVLDENKKVVGFSCGPTTFYTDGRERNDVRVAAEFTSIAKHYTPAGSEEAWTKAATFLAQQNNPAFTAILAAAFGAPLLRFTGFSGGILSIVSSASGVGKSSALKSSQAVWGSPSHGMNAVDDTPKSVARKLSFLNNLPAYWDELRGRRTIEEFVPLAFQIAQGKEKTRLDSSANMREIQTWETMLVVASNDSIFEAMARGTTGSDGGVARAYEMVVEPFETDRNRAELGLMFAALGENYGHAGRRYAKHIATNLPSVITQVEELFQKLALMGQMKEGERFWFAIMSVLLVGAGLARDAGLVDIDTKTLGRYLLTNLQTLRMRAKSSVAKAEPNEVLAAFIAAFQDRCLLVDKYPHGKANTKNYQPEVIPPRIDKIMMSYAREEQTYRFTKQSFTSWLANQGFSPYTILKEMESRMGAREIQAQLGVGTKWVLPRTRLLEVKVPSSMAQLPETLAKITSAVASHPDETTDSHAQTEPED
jgi:hypothetical protein